MSVKRKLQGNKEHKDRLFNYIFGSEENRKWTLQLYNAVNKSNYKDASLIEFNTLQNYLYVSMKNDTSFIIADTMSLYEHQSTYNPNMPLRMLRYVSNLYSKYIEENALDVYGVKLLRLPVPKLVVFYNGDKKIPEESMLKLSDSFAPEHRDKSDIEVRVRMININYGENRNILQACRPLEEYSWLIDRIKNYRKTNSLEQATTLAINEMPEYYEIKGFLKKHMAEVIDMMLAEDQEINALDLIARANKKAGEEIGEKRGEKRGEKKGLKTATDTIIKNMINAGSFTDEQISIATGKSIDYIIKVKMNQK